MLHMHIKCNMQMHYCKMCLWDKKNNNNSVNKPNTKALYCSIWDLC